MKKFKILETGNFYFPLINKGKKFKVEDTMDFIINKRYTKLIESCLKSKDNIYFGMLAEAIWDAIKKESKKYKNYWLVPLVLNKIGKNYICSIDILKEVK